MGDSLSHLDISCIYTILNKIKAVVHHFESSSLYVNTNFRVIHDLSTR